MYNFLVLGLVFSLQLGDILCMTLAQVPPVPHIIYCPDNKHNIDPQPPNPCEPSPCGPNAQCRGSGICTCLPEYHGDPYNGCRPECVQNPDCPSNRVCINNECADPCPGVCGQNAECMVVNHVPMCSCPVGMTGNAFALCTKADVIPIVYPCEPSPCGPNSRCQSTNGRAVCSCVPGFIGQPPACRPECTVNSDCPLDRACINNKCADPCPGVCGQNAECMVVNNVPLCSCPVGMTGNAFALCTKADVIPIVNPCEPSPCGPNSRCQSKNGDAVCSCVPGFIGQPPACRPECTVNSDCPLDRACVKNKCADPCPGICGQNAECMVVNHVPMCSCPVGMTRNAFALCTKADVIPIVNPCEPSPCGPNSRCQSKNGDAVCSCVPGFIGAPPACRPECTVNSDCPLDRACINQKCADPCLGSCGFSARCQVVNHNPICSCPSTFTGSPFDRCYPMIIETQPEDSLSKLAESLNNIISAPVRERQNELSTNVKNIGKELSSEYLVTKGIGAHKLHLRKESWNKARKICIEEGGQLADIKTDSEEKIVLRMMVEDAVDTAWIGYHDMFGEGDWVSILGEPLGKSGWDRWWKKRLPNPDNQGGNEDCACLMKDGGGMNDNLCSRKLAFVCKITAL